jgi:hypothetical protein
MRSWQFAKCHDRQLRDVQLALQNLAEGSRDQVSLFLLGKSVMPDVRG